MIRIHPPDLQRMHEELQQAIRGHAEWHRRLVRTLVCRQPPATADLRDDAHRCCGFGQWLYHQAQQDLQGRPECELIETEHRRLHGLAARLLREMVDSGSVSLGEFDDFVAGSARLRLQLDSLRHEMSVALRSRDVLTGTYRRVEILPALREARELLLRGVQQSCIAFMDLDHFKAVNDTHGHGVGDEVLSSAAKCVTDHLRRYDKVFRYGGDEFLVLLPGTSPEEAWQLVERIRGGLERTQLGVTAAGEPIHLTTSFGITPIVPDLEAEDCIARADKALLLAKASGRNRTVCWDPAISTGTVHEREFSARPATPGSAAR
jgi:diguanylate cyclase (GGDEF)-like protein